MEKTNRKRGFPPEGDTDEECEFPQGKYEYMCGLRPSANAYTGSINTSQNDTLLLIIILSILVLRMCGKHFVSHPLFTPINRHSPTIYGNFSTRGLYVAKRNPSETVNCSPSSTLGWHEMFG
jgi:hypothetical protein